ncbi:MAG: ATP-binding cassette domain-containing protein [Spirochaetales bacterium]|nr:ATP-binding cassette domain-containing protein [Spirochaetales bacterium]
MAANKKDPFVKLKNINLNINNIQILKDINLSFYPAEIHALVGHHGAGKSSLGQVINGTMQADSGEIHIQNKCYHDLSLQKSAKLGIEMVYQQIHLLDYFTVADNILIPNKWSHPYLFRNKRKLHNEAEQIIKKYNLSLDPGKLVKNLELSEKIAVAVLRSIIRSPKVLILDEALEKMSSKDYQEIRKLLMDLKDSGIAVILITHRIDDIYELADKVSIIKNGHILLTEAVSEMDRFNLIKMTYTQISKTQNNANTNQEFYQMLKYNEAILQKLPMNIIVTDNEHKIKMINEFGEKYFEIDIENYLNKSLKDFLKSNNSQLCDILFASLDARVEKELYNLPLNLKTYQAISNIKIFPFYDGNFFIGNIIIIEDITKQEQMRQQVILSEKLASVGLLAAGVAHEINNPLEIIYNHLNYLKFDLDKESIKKTLGYLEDEMESIKQIVSNLILFSDNRQRMNEKFEFNEVVQSIIDLIKFKTKKMGISINFHKEQPNIIYHANKNEIKQVLLNLFKNSIEAMPNGGTIKIITACHKIDEDDEILLIFSDTGTGINAKDPNNIFLPFYSTKNKGGSNLGLGLSVSYGIIKKFKGQISVRNRKSGGCEFKISLPVLKFSLQDQSIDPERMEYYMNPNKGTPLDQFTRDPFEK